MNIYSWGGVKKLIVEISMINDFYSDNVQVTKEKTHLLIQKLEREKKLGTVFTLQKQVRTRF